MSTKLAGGLAAFAVVFLAACSGGGSEPAADSAADPAPSTAAPSVSRVVALGEEFLLADLLALGVRPVASTATVADVGFQGIEGHDTDGIVALPSYEPNVERLSTFRPDTIVVGEFVFAYVPLDRFEALADVVVVPDQSTLAERLELLERAFDREAGLEHSNARSLMPAPRHGRKFRPTVASRS